MNYFNFFVLFLFGLGIGSFLNVISLRYQPNNGFFNLKTINGRSKCPDCHRQLAWYELVPILSFLIQKGRCLHCKRRLSLQYPLIEILTGLIFVFVPLSLTYLLRQGFSEASNLRLTTYGFNYLQLLVVGCWLLVFLLLILLSIIDFRNYIIPDAINILLAICGIILITLTTRNSQLATSFIGHYYLLFGYFSNVWLNHIFAAAFGMIFFGLIIILSRGKAMGWGDFKLAGALGLVFGWPDFLMILFLSFITGAVSSLFLLAKKEKTMKDVVPFGPFLAIGAALTFFFGFQIIDFYFKFFGILY